MMEGTTFDLTAPMSIQPKPMQKVPPPDTQSQATKKQEAKPTQRLPVLGNQSKSTKQRMQQTQSSKSLQRQKKIEIFREALDLAIKQQPVASNKKEKKMKPSQESQKQQLDEIKNEYQEMVKEHYRDVYTKPKNQVTEALKNLEAKPKVKDNLNRTEENLNKKKLFNDKLLYEIKQMMIKNKRLDELLNDLNQTDTTTPKTIEELQIEEDEQEEKLRQMAYEIAILKGMQTKRRRLLLEVQKNCRACHDDLMQSESKFNAMSGSVMFRKKQAESLSKMVLRYRKEQMNPQAFFGASLQQRFDPLLEDILEDELSKCGDMLALQEVTQKEKQIKQINEQKEREKRSIQQQKAQQEMDKATQQIRQDKKQIDTLLQKKKEMFEKLRRVTSIADLERIIPHKNEMDAGQKELKDIQEFVSKEIERFEKDNESLKCKIKELKYEEENQKFDKQINIDILEREQVNVSDQLEDKEKQVKKVEKSIDEVTMALSRTLYQLQGKGTKNKNIEIQRKGLVGAASQIQLRLERMLTVLSKTQEFLNEESVNTNPGYTKMPDFIGLNARRYADMDQQDYVDNNNIRFNYREDESQDENDQLVDELRGSIKAITEDKAQIIVTSKKDKKIIKQ